MTDLLDGLDGAERKALAIVACAHWLPQAAIEADLKDEIVPALPELLRLGLVRQTSAGALTVPASLRDELLSPGVFDREMIFGISARLAPLFQWASFESQIEASYHRLAVDPDEGSRQMCRLVLSWAAEPFFAFTDIQRLIDVWQEFEARWGLSKTAAAHLRFAEALEPGRKPAEELALIESLELPEDSLLAAQADLRRGQLLTVLNQHDRAEAALIRAYDAFGSIDYKVGCVNAGRALGRLYAKLDRYDEARVRHEGALELSRQLGLPIASAQCLQGLAEIDTFSGDLDRATARYNEAIETLERHGGQTAEAFSRLLLSQVLIMRGDLDTASNHIERATRIYELLGKPLGQANAHRFAAAVDLEAGRLDKAREKSDAARAEYESLKTSTGVAACKEIAAQIAMVEGDIAAASSLLRDAASQFEQIDDRFGAANCLRDLGVLALLERDDVRATELLTRSATEFEEIGAKLESALSRVMLSAADPDVAADDDRRRLVEAGVTLPRAFHEAWTAATGGEWAASA